MITHDFTGTSTKGYDEAVMLALTAATEFLSDMQDAHVVIKELSQDEQEHYLALLEVTKDPLGPVYTREEFEDVDDKADDPEEKFRVFRQKGYASLRALIAAHFKKKGAAVPSSIPDFILAPLTAVDIENNAIEKDFLFAAEAMPMPIVDEPMPVVEAEEPAPAAKPQGPETQPQNQAVAAAG